MNNELNTSSVPFCWYSTFSIKRRCSLRLDELVLIVSSVIKNNESSTI